MWGANMSSIEPNLDLNTKLGDQAAIGKRFTLDDIATYSKSSAISRIFKNISFIFQRKGILTESKVKELLGSLQPQDLFKINDIAQKILDKSTINPGEISPRDLVKNTLTEIKNKMRKPVNEDFSKDFKVVLLSTIILGNFSKELEFVRKHYHFSDGHASFSSDALTKEVVQEMIEEKINKSGPEQKNMWENLKEIWSQPDDEKIKSGMKEIITKDTNLKIKNEKEKMTEFQNSIDLIDSDIEKKTQELNLHKSALEGLARQPDVFGKEFEDLSKLTEELEKDINSLAKKKEAQLENKQRANSYIKLWENDIEKLSKIETLGKVFPLELNQETAKGKYLAILETGLGTGIFTPLFTSFPLTQVEATINPHQWTIKHEFNRSKDVYDPGLTEADLNSTDVNVEFGMENLDKLSIGSAYKIDGKKRDGDPIADDMVLKRYYIADNKELILFSGADGSGHGSSSRNAAIVANRTYIETFEDKLSTTGKKTLRYLAQTSIDALQLMQETLPRIPGDTLDYTQRDISAANKNALTTHLGFVAVKNDHKIEGVISSIGDMKVFIRKKDGTVSDLTLNNRSGFGGNDPGGQLGGEYLDSRNLQLIHFSADEGDVLLPMSDGIHDNLTSAEIEGYIKDLNPKENNLAEVLVQQAKLAGKKPDHLSAAQIVL